MTVFAAVLIGYLLGSVSFSYLIAKKVKKIDIRKHGSGNAGATNTLRILGLGPALFVLALDVAKGIAAVWICVWLGGEAWELALAGSAAIIGHNWPVFYGFRGGKGVATTIGVFATLFFIPSLYSGITAILLIVIFRYVSLGSLFFMVTAPVLTLFIGTYPVSYFYAGCVIAIIALWRHRTNITRLLSGTESKIGEKKSSNVMR